MQRTVSDGVVMRIAGWVAVLFLGLVLGGFAKEIGGIFGKFAAQRGLSGFQEGGLAEVTRQAAIELNKQLPMAVDGNTTLLGVTAAGATMNYHHQLNATVDDGRRPMVQSNLNKAIPPRVCSNSKMKEMLNKGLSYSYQYVDAQGIYVGEVVVTAASCQPRTELEKFLDEHGGSR